MYLAAQEDNPFGSTFALLFGYSRHRRTRRPDQDSGPRRCRPRDRPDHHGLRRNASVSLRRPDAEIQQRIKGSAGKPADLRRADHRRRSGFICRAAETSGCLQYLSGDRRAQRDAMSSRPSKRPFHPSSRVRDPQPRCGSLLDLFLSHDQRRRRTGTFPGDERPPSGLGGEDRRRLVLPRPGDCFDLHRGVRRSPGARPSSMPRLFIPRHDQQRGSERAQVPTTSRARPTSQVLTKALHSPGDCCPRHRRSLRSRQRGGPSGLHVDLERLRSKPSRTPSRRFARGHIQSQRHQVEDRSPRNYDQPNQL